MAAPWKPPKGEWVKTTFGMGVKVLAIDEPSRTAWVKADHWEYPATHHWSQLRPNVPTPEELAAPWKPTKDEWVVAPGGMRVEVLAVHEPSQRAWVKADDWRDPLTYCWSVLSPDLPTPEELAALDAAVAEAAEAYWYGVPGLPGLPGSRRTLIVALDAALKARRDARARLAREA